MTITRAQASISSAYTIESSVPIKSAAKHNNPVRNSDSMTSKFACQKIRPSATGIVVFSDTSIQAAKNTGTMPFESIDSCFTGPDIRGLMGLTISAAAIPATPRYKATLLMQVVRSSAETRGKK